MPTQNKASILCSRRASTAPHTPGRACPTGLTSIPWRHLLGGDAGHHHPAGGPGGSDPPTARCWARTRTLPFKTSLCLFLPFCKMGQKWHLPGWWEGLWTVPRRLSTTLRIGRHENAWLQGSHGGSPSRHPLLSPGPGTRPFPVVAALSCVLIHLKGLSTPACSMPTPSLPATPCPLSSQQPGAPARGSAPTGCEDSDGEL